MRLSALLFIVLFFSCSEDGFYPETCQIPATIRDLSGLDGCGFVFELDNGTILEPKPLFYCGTPPLPAEVTEDPLFNFSFEDGKRVKIGFEFLEDHASICMMGQVVKITCIEELSGEKD